MGINRVAIQRKSDTELLEALGREGRAYLNARRNYVRARKTRWATQNAGTWDTYLSDFEREGTACIALGEAMEVIAVLEHEVHRRTGNPPAMSVHDDYAGEDDGL
jgi:hypothetical protein